MNIRFFSSLKQKFHINQQFCNLCFAILKGKA